MPATTANLAVILDYEEVIYAAIAQRLLLGISMSRDLLRIDLQQPKCPLHRLQEPQLSFSCIEEMHQFVAATAKTGQGCYKPRPVV